ncbi:MAG: hypothetical protein MR946_01670 [Faecalibacterium sp.]|nr:hypothetical protein [Faecalibacterium sp.]
MRGMMFPAGNDVVLRTNDVCLAAQWPPAAAASFPAKPEHPCEAHHLPRGGKPHCGTAAPFLCFAQTVPFIHDRMPKNAFESKTLKQISNKNAFK